MRRISSPCFRSSPLNIWKRGNILHHTKVCTLHMPSTAHNCGRIKSTKWDNQWTSKSIKQLYLDQFFFHSGPLVAFLHLVRFIVFPFWYTVHDAVVCLLWHLYYFYNKFSVIRHAGSSLFRELFCLSHHGGNYSKRDTKTPLRVIGFVCTGISTFAYRMNIFSRHKSSLTLR